MLHYKVHGEIYVKFIIVVNEMISGATIDETIPKKFT
jgi:hypothetical protein